MVCRRPPVRLAGTDVGVERVAQLGGVPIGQVDLVGHSIETELHRFPSADINIRAVEVINQEDLRSRCYNTYGKPRGGPRQTRSL